jgi:hypothetical protein
VRGSDTGQNPRVTAAAEIVGGDAQVWSQVVDPAQLPAAVLPGKIKSTPEAARSELSSDAR